MGAGYNSPMPDHDSHLSRRTFLKAGSALLLVTTAAGFPEAASADDGGPLRLQNDLLQAQFDGRGLTALHDKALNRTIPFSGDGFAATLDRATLDSAQFPAPMRSQGKNTVSYRYVLGPHVVTVTYELQTGWRFVSKQMTLDTTLGTDYRVKSLTPFRATLGTAVVEELLSRDVAADEAWDESFGTFLRFGGQPDYGLFFAVQNPFMNWHRDGQQVSVSYAPEMDWQPNYGPFPGDRVCVGPYGLSGHIFPGLDSDTPGRDIAEWQALTDCVRAFLLSSPKKSARLHAGWSENDYRIDVATPQGQSEYKRIIDQTAAVGCLNLLYAPSNSALSSGVKSEDLGVWENVLWLGLGQKIRQGKWDPESDPVPLSVKAMQDYAAKHDVKLDAYVYPSLPWRPAWSTGEWANCANREFQDWLIGKLVDFQRKTEVSGYWFENWQLDEGRRLNYAEASPYAQWYGCRWILESLHDRLPDLMIGGGANVKPSPWTWLAVTFPFRSLDFKPPGWIGTPPDLHIDRLHGNSQRWTAWRYCTVFWPSEILPGSLIHERTNRDTEDAPGWDYLGWKYSVLSSIATAPMNHVINYLPARDEAEYAHFAPEDKKWLRDWLDWTDTHRETLRHVRPITGPPRMGLVDGTAAITADRGFVFFFNPDYRAGDAEFRMDSSIGLTQGQTFILTALHPRPGPVGFGRYGDTISLPMEATSALVLEITPARPKLPLLLYPTGSVSLNGQTLAVSPTSAGLSGKM